MNSRRWRITSDADPALELGPSDVSEYAGKSALVARLAPSPAEASVGQERYEVVVDGWRFVFVAEPAERATLRERASRGGAARAGGGRLPVRAQIPGRVVFVAVAEGERVESGQKLLSV